MSNHDPDVDHNWSIGALSNSYFLTEFFSQLVVSTSNDFRISSITVSPQTGANFSQRQDTEKGE